MIAKIVGATDRNCASPEAHASPEDRRTLSVDCAMVGGAAIGLPGHRSRCREQATHFSRRSFTDSASSSRVRPTHLVVFLDVGLIETAAQTELAPAQLLDNRGDRVLPKLGPTSFLRPFRLDDHSPQPRVRKS